MVYVVLGFVPSPWNVVLTIPNAHRALRTIRRHLSKSVAKALFSIGDEGRAGLFGTANRERRRIGIVVGEG